MAKAQRKLTSEERKICEELAGAALPALGIKLSSAEREALVSGGKVSLQKRSALRRLRRLTTNRPVSVAIGPKRRNKAIAPYGLGAGDKSCVVGFSSCDEASVERVGRISEA